jgi:hypothetical protein
MRTNKKISKEKKEVENIDHLMNLLFFKTNITLGYKEKAIFRRHILKKYSYKEIVSGILVMNFMRSAEITVHLLQKILKLQREKGVVTKQNLEKLESLMRGINKEYAKK